MAAEPQQVITVDEYLAIERANEERHEYIDGHMYLMAGGTADNDTMALNIALALRAGLRGRCRVHTADMRVQVMQERYVYPDVSITCDERDRGQIDVIQHPRVIVEVLSPSTEAYDRGRKFDYYRGCPSMQEYVLVNSDRRLVEVYRRTPKRFWTYHTFEPSDEIELASVDVRFPVAEVYADVDVGT